MYAPRASRQRAERFPYHSISAGQLEPRATIPQRNLGCFQPHCLDHVDSVTCEKLPVAVLSALVAWVYLQSCRLHGWSLHPRFAIILFERLELALALAEARLFCARLNCSVAGGSSIVFPHLGGVHLKVNPAKVRDVCRQGISRA